MLLTPDKAVVTRDADAEGPDLAAPKHDGFDTPRLWISPDGKVVRLTEPPATPGASTLEAIQLTRLQQKPDPDVPALDEDTPEETGAKRRKPRAVEGPDTIAQDLARVALGVAASVPGEAIAAAVLAACAAPDDGHRLAANRALLERSKSTGITPKALQKARIGLTDRIAGIRSVSAEIAALSDEGISDLAALPGDSDPMVRAVAVRYAVDPSSLSGCLADPAQIVRRAALGRVLEAGDPAPEPGIVDTLLAAERTDTLRNAVHASPSIMTDTLPSLSDKALSSRQVHVLLQGLARDDTLAAPLPA